MTKTLTFSSLMNRAAAEPLMSAEEERLCAKRYRETGDDRHLEPLIRTHMRIAGKFIQPKRLTEDEIRDAWQEIGVGLTLAARKFDPSQFDNRFVTYAYPWVRSLFYDWLMRRPMVRAFTSSRTRKAAFFNLGKRHAELVAEGRSAAQAYQELAPVFEMTPEDLQSLHAYMRVGDASLSTPITEDGDMTLEDTLVDTTETPEDSAVQADLQKRRHEMLTAALSGLPTRDRDILIHRYADDTMTLEDLGKRYGVSRERIRQIESRAFKTLKQTVQEMGGGELAA